jgi:hypothetical protein
MPLPNNRFGIFVYGPTSTGMDAALAPMGLEGIAMLLASFQARVWGAQPGFYPRIKIGLAKANQLARTEETRGAFL